MVATLIYWLRIIFCLRLYHEEWRTNESLVNQGTDNENELAAFSFRGFKGDYEIKLMDGNEVVKIWTANLANDTEWVLFM